MTESGRSYKEFFDQERARLDAHIRGLERQLEELRTARAAAQAELDRLERAMRLLEDAPTNAEPRPKMTIKEGVMQVLEEAPQGLTAFAIQQRLRTELDMAYERTSLSPQLSRLKAQGKIGLKGGGVWYLRKMKTA